MLWREQCLQVGETIEIESIACTFSDMIHFVVPDGISCGKLFCGVINPSSKIFQNLE